MEIVWGAASSYVLENKKSTEDLLEPSLFADRIKDGRLPRCQLGTKGYAAFRLREGPKCPNSESHIKARAVPEKAKWAVKDSVP